jgi:uncharacterized RDD family membrane protein YckC
MSTPSVSPSILRRIVCMLYESLLLLALLMFAALLFLFVFGDATEAPKRYIFQCYLWLVSAAYFVWHWTRGGQTLAMQTWRIKLMTVSGDTLSASQAMKRYILASLLFGLTFIWALFDRDGQYLHDRLSGNQLSLMNKKPK